MAFKNNQRDWREKQKVIFPALFSIVAYCGAVIGEGLPLLDLVGVELHHYDVMNHPQPDERHPLQPIGLIQNGNGKEISLDAIS